MSYQQLIAEINELKFKLAMHFEQRPSYAVNTGYVEYLERQIELRQAMLDKRVAA